VSEFERYTTDAMSRVWSGDWKMRRWAEIEIAAANALGAPLKAIDEMSRATVPSFQAVTDEEARTQHDVIAFLNLWRADMGPEGRAWSHRGLTSSDVVDTANGLRMKACTDIIRASLVALTRTVVRNALLYKDAVRVGRTHGQYAEVTTWGWRLAVFAYDLIRAERRLSMLADLYEVGKFSGPVGDFKGLSVAQELSALSSLGLHPSGASTQVVSRDTYVDFVHALAQIASVVEAIALEVRLSSRSEVGEMREGTLGSQRGSSAMPHKRNPITAEKLSGLARVVRGQVDQVAQGVALHHERDISHSSVERMALNLASQVTDYMLNQANTMVANLRVYPERMRANVEGNLELLSSLIKTRLTSDYGVDPAHAYEVVFWGFQEWNRPKEDRGPDSPMYDSLADALAETWDQIAERQYWDRSNTPDFEAMTALLEHPADLLGHTSRVFAELELWLNPPEHQKTPPEGS